MHKKRDVKAEKFFKKMDDLYNEDPVLFKEYVRFKEENKGTIYHLSGHDLNELIEQFIQKEKEET